MSRKEKYSKRRWPWQPKPENGSLSTPMNMDRLVTAPQAQQPASSLPGILHRSCSTLPLSHFIEIIINGDLRWLITNGSPSQEQLAAAWDDILEEYLSLIKTDKADNIFELYKKIKHTEWQLVYADKCLLALKIRYDIEIADWLGQLGFGLPVPSDSREEYLKSLYRIETAAKMLIVLLNQYKAEYALLNKDKEDEKIQLSPAEGRFRYEKEIAMLSRYQGQRIIKEKITVLEYAAIIPNCLDGRRAQAKEVQDGG